jgi:hypothetical protein
MLASNADTSGSSLHVEEHRFSEDAKAHRFRLMVQDVTHKDQRIAGSGFKLPRTDAALLAEFFTKILLSNQQAPSLTSVETYFNKNAEQAAMYFDVIHPYPGLHTWANAMDESFSCADAALGVKSLAGVVMGYLCGDLCGYRFKPQASAFVVDEALRILVRMSSPEFARQMFRGEISGEHFELLLRETPGSVSAITHYLCNNTIHSSRSRRTFLVKYKDVFLPVLHGEIYTQKKEEINVVYKMFLHHVTKRRETSLADLRELMNVLSDPELLDMAAKKMERVQTAMKRKQRRHEKETKRKARVVTE